MEATLTSSEMETIAKMVSDKLHARFIADGSHKELRSATENYTKQMIDFYLKESSVAFNVKEMIKPFFDEHLKETNIVEQQLIYYMNTEHFKKLELKHLQQRVIQLERELYEE